MPSDRSHIGDIQDGAKADGLLHAEAPVHNRRYFARPGDSVDSRRELRLLRPQVTGDVAVIDDRRVTQGRVLGHDQGGIGKDPVVENAETSPDRGLARAEYVIGKPNSRPIVDAAIVYQSPWV